MKISKMKNLIVHNPISVSFYETAAGDTYFRLNIISSTSGKYLELDDLQQLVNKMELLAKELFTLISALKKGCP